MTRLKFISKGFKQILMSDGTRGLVLDQAQAIADRANSNTPGFVADVRTGGYGGGRYIAFASSSDVASSTAESKDKVLSKAVTG